MTDYTTIRIRKMVADRLRVEAAKMTAATGQTWSMGRLIAVLLGHAKNLPERRTRTAGSR